MTSRLSLIFLIFAVANASAKSVVFKPLTNISTEYLENNENLSPNAYRVIASRSFEFPYVKNSSEKIKLSKSIDPESSADIFAGYLDNNDNNNENLSPNAYKVITYKTSRSPAVSPLENSYPEVIEEISEEIQVIHTHRIIKTIRHRGNRNKPSCKKSDKKKATTTAPFVNFINETVTIPTSTNDKNTNETESSKKSSATTPSPFVNFVDEPATTPTSASDKNTESSIHEVTTFGGIDEVDNYAINKTHHEITKSMREYNNGTMVKMIFEEPAETPMAESSTLTNSSASSEVPETEESNTTNLSVSLETSTSEPLALTNSSASIKISMTEASKTINSSVSETSTSGSLAMTDSLASSKTAMTDASTQTNSSDLSETFMPGPSVSSKTSTSGSSTMTNSSASSKTFMTDASTQTNSSDSSETFMPGPSTMAESSISSETPKLILSRNATPVLLEISKPVPSTTTQSPKRPAPENSSWTHWIKNKIGWN